jgi:Aspartyl protease
VSALISAVGQADERQIYAHPMRPGRVLATATVLIATAACGSAARPAGSAHGAGSVYVPIVLSGSPPTIKPLVRVTLRGRPYYLIVDTGAARTIIDRPVANALGLPAHGSPYTFSTFGCDVSAQPVSLAGMHLGSTALPTITVFSERLLIPRGFSGVPIGGLLGSDILSRFGVVTISFTRRRLILRAKAPTGGRTVPVTALRPIGGVLETTWVDFDDHRARFLVDTAAPISLIDWAAPAGRDLKPAGPATSVAGAACRSAMTPVRVGDWRIAGLHLRGAIVGRAHRVLPATLVREGIIGIAGASTLTRFGALTIDYARSSMTLGGTVP